MTKPTSILMIYN